MRSNLYFVCAIDLNDIVNKLDSWHKNQAMPCGMAKPAAKCRDVLILFLFFSFVCLKEIDTFIQQGCIKLIKSEGIDIYNVTVDFYFK